MSSQASDEDTGVDWLLDGPALVGRAWNGGVVDTDEKFAVEPVIMMTMALDATCSQFEYGNGPLAKYASSNLWLAFMCLKGWAYDAVNDGSGIFLNCSGRIAELRWLIDMTCKALSRAQKLMRSERFQRPEWKVGSYDQRVEQCPVGELQQRLSKRLASASVPSS